MMKRISYRTTRWILGVGLLGLSHLGAAQTAPTPDDSIKGRLWTATAERIWADAKPKQKQPAPWPTVQAFKKWLAANPADKSELGLLRADVVNSFGAGTRATPVEVARAIISQLTQRQQSGQGRLARVKASLLGADLAPLTQASGGAAPAPAAPRPTTGTTTVTAVPGAGGITVLPANPDSITNQPIRTPDPASTFISTPVTPTYFGLTPLQAAIVLLILGGLAGLAFGQNMRRPGRGRRRSYAGPTPPAEPATSPAMNSPEYRKLHQQNLNLKADLRQLKKQLADLQVRLPGAPPTPPPAVEAAPAAELTVEELVGASAPTPPSATRYGPVQETPFVEERKLVNAPLPQLALMLTVNPRQPDQATFTLNPQVDQVRLIGDGLTRLQKFFDYDPPLGGRITAVAAVRPGRLQRQDSGWQVVERARLSIS
ncbi:hypothetical protein [Hymenobacter psoromatis]|uniref:hypothetical protein n=1 Tax=Hymenobacter psoromatis TaxID=1484116 RepID=UPI001CC0E018|nr:hypothetical protein [Hymenobacter psoromatis]